MKAICARCRHKCNRWLMREVKLVVGSEVVARFMVCETCAGVLVEDFNREVFGEG